MLFLVHPIGIAQEAVSVNSNKIASGGDKREGAGVEIYFFNSLLDARNWKTHDDLLNDRTHAESQGGKHSRCKECHREVSRLRRQLN
jgi:hypothetical protein